MDNIFNIDNLSEAELRDIFDNSETKQDIDNKDICPNCLENTNLIEDKVNGQLVCINSNCGQVIGILIDKNPEWRQFEDDNKNDNRCSMPINILLPQSSLGTSMGGNYKSRLRTLHIWGRMPYKERSVLFDFEIIRKKCLEGKIVDCIKDDAVIMYKSISECKHLKGKNKGKYIIIRGKNRHSLIAACVFFACKRNGKTRSPKEIGQLFDLKYTEITRGCKNFLKLMKIIKFNITINSSNPEHFVMRFCNELNIKKPFADQAIQISKNISRLNIASVHTPLSTATSSILLMAHINNLKYITKKKISVKFNVSEVTITKTYQKLDKFKKVLIDDGLTDKLIKIIAENKDNIVISEQVLARFKKFNIDPNINQYKNKEQINNFEMCQALNINEFSDLSEIDELDNMSDLDNISEIGSISDLDNISELNNISELSYNMAKSKEIDINNICNLCDDIYDFFERYNISIYNNLLITDIEYEKIINKK